MTGHGQGWAPAAASHQVDSGSQSRFAKRHRKGKNVAAMKQLDQIPASSYTDADAAFDAGVQLEEKAERFAVGDKAVKFYRLSLDVYRRVLQLQNGNADAAYNAARVLFALATSFSLPPTSVRTLQESIEAYKQALSMSPPTSSYDGLPNAFFLDVQYNLAVAQLTLAEQLDRLGLDGDGTQRTSAIVQESIAGFESVLRAQEAVLRHQEEQEALMEGADVERPPLVEEDSDPEGANTAATNQHMGSGNVQTEYTTSLITPVSALETIANLHSSALLLLDCAAGYDDLARTAVRLATHYHGTAQSIQAAFPDGERRSPDNDWNEQVASLKSASVEVKIAALTKIRHDTRQQQMGALAALLEEVTREANALLEQSDLPSGIASTSAERASDKIRTQALEQLADMSLTLSRVCIACIHDLRTNTPDEMGSRESIALTQAAWQTCTQTSKLLLAAVKALDSTNPTTVIGTSHSFNPTTRRRAAIYVSLSSVSVLRSDAVFMGSGIVAGVNEGTRKTLLDNARVYARKALTEVGFAGWLSKASAGDSAVAAYDAPHGGLDSVAVDVDASLALLRALGLRAIGPDASVADAAKHEAAAFCANLAAAVFGQASAPDVAETWRACFGLQPTTPTPRGRRMLEQAIGEEGEKTVLPQELTFWEDVEATLTLGDIVDDSRS